jgi:hypothetical protein
MADHHHDFFSFSADEAYRLVTAAGVPLFGESTPARTWWLDPEEASFERWIFNVMNKCVLLKETTVHCCDIYDILESLFIAFDGVAKGRPVVSHADIQHALTVAKRLRSLIKSLDHPRARLIGGGKPMDEFLADCRAQDAKLALWASALDRKLTNGGGQSLAAFIRGRLADTYDRLFWRDAGGNESGPFARFGVAFFEMVGRKVAPATIARALKEKPRSRKKRSLLRLVHPAQ